MAQGVLLGQALEPNDMEPTTLFLRPSFQIAVQPGTGALEVQVEAQVKQLPPSPPPVAQLPVTPRWLSRH